jgi:hypothetical protein
VGKKWWVESGMEVDELIVLVFDWDCIRDLTLMIYNKYFLLLK